MGLPDRYTANPFLLCKWVYPNLPNKERYWFFFQSITGFRIWTGAPFGFLPNSRWIILSGSHLRFPNKLGHGLNMLRLKQEKTDFTGWWYTYPSKNMKVRWDDYPQYMENNKCSKPPTIFNYVYIYIFIYSILYIYIYICTVIVWKNTHIFETTNQILVASPRDWEVTYPIISPCTADWT